MPWQITQTAGGDDDHVELVPKGWSADLQDEHHPEKKPSLPPEEIDRVRRIIDRLKPMIKDLDDDSTS